MEWKWENLTNEERGKIIDLLLKDENIRKPIEDEIKEKIEKAKSALTGKEWAWLLFFFVGGPILGIIYLILADQ